MIRKLEIAEIGAEPEADAGTDRYQHDVIGGERGHPEAANKIGRSVDTAKAQPADKGAAGLLAKHIAVGLAPLAHRLFDDHRQAARYAAEEAVSGIDQFIG